MGVSEEKLKNLISSIQAPIICDAMNLWYIQHSLDILHAILVVHPVTPYPVEAPEFIRGE
jgi:hypothetical protein